MRKRLTAFLAGLALLLPMAAQADEPKAINFQFTDVEGRAFQLSDFKGKWVLVNFWAPWCPLCWVEVPTLNELNKRKDFVVIGVGLDYGPGPQHRQGHGQSPWSGFPRSRCRRCAAQSGQPVPSGRPGRFLSDFLCL